MFVSASQVKNCGRRCIFSGQIAIFHKVGKTHRDMRVIPPCLLNLYSDEILDKYEHFQFLCRLID